MVRTSKLTEFQIDSNSSEIGNLHVECVFALEQSVSRLDIRQGRMQVTGLDPSIRFH